MIHRNKLILQSRAAMFEKKEHHRAIQTNLFTCADYVALHLMVNAVTYTMAAALIVGVYLMYQIESLSITISLNDLRYMLLSIGEIYLIGLGIFLVITLVVSLIRYNKAAAKCREYRSVLRRLEACSERWRRAEAKKAEGRSN
ncbi:MAG: hypothetical protein J5825_00150 [Lachnospiraceae bacterium]|nr:hypothetical protein [Lachnospiraceae bacterium]